MESHRLQVTFFSVLVVIALTFTFFIFQPYLVPLFLSIIFAVAMYPVYGWITRQVGNRRSLGAFLTVSVFFLAILIPATLFSFALFNEVRQLYGSIATGGETGIVHTISTVVGDKVSLWFPSASIDIEAYVQGALDWFTRNLGTFFSSFVGLLLGMVILVFSMFFLFRDGKRLADEAVHVSPLPDKTDTQIFKRISQVINAVLVSTVAVALIKAILSAIGFFIFHVPNPIFWGTLAGVASLVPAVGSFLIIIPVLIYMAATASIGLTIGLSVWCVLLVGLVDNLVMPLLLRRGAKVHPFLGFLSVIGGVVFFGPVGIIAGPVVLGVLIALAEAYPNIINKNK